MLESSCTPLRSRERPLCTPRRPGLWRHVCGDGAHAAGKMGQRAANVSAKPGWHMLCEIGLCAVSACTCMCLRTNISCGATSSRLCTPLHMSTTHTYPPTIPPLASYDGLLLDDRKSKPRAGGKLAGGANGGRARGALKKSAAGARPGGHCPVLVHRTWKGQTKLKLPTIASHYCGQIRAEFIHM